MWASNYRTHVHRSQFYASKLDAWATKDAIHAGKSGPLEFVLLGMSQTVPATPAQVFQNTSSNTFNTSFARFFFEHNLFDVLMQFVGLQGHVPITAPDTTLIKSLLQQPNLKPVGPGCCIPKFVLLTPVQLRVNCLANWPKALNDLFHQDVVARKNSSPSNTSSKPPVSQSPSKPETTETNPDVQSTEEGSSQVLVLAQSCVKELRNFTQVHKRDQGMLRPTVINNMEIAASAISWMIDVRDMLTRSTGNGG